MARRFLVSFFVAACALMILPPQSSAQKKKTDGEWVSLFNGKNLDGWTVKIAGHKPGDNYLDTFRVEDGVIKVSYDKYKQFDGKFGHLFYKDKFSDYDLRLQYRFVGEQAKRAPGWAIRNSGVMFHSQSPQSMRNDQEFPVSIEFQFLGGLGKGERPTGSMCSPGTNVVMGGKLITQHCVDSKSKTFNGDEWVRAELQVRGSGKIKHLINGEVVIEYEQPQLDPKDKDGSALLKAAKGKLLLVDGYIALQAESHPCEFRNIEVRVLKRAAPLRQAHAHNDYEHKRPLLDALEQGFCSVEADVFLVGDELLVGHTRLDLRPERTLEKLYLAPLQQRVRSNDGRVYRGGSTFYLLIDVKTEARPTYAAVDKLLAKYGDILSVTRDAKHQAGAVTVAISGNCDRETILKQNVRYAGIDGRPSDLDSEAPAELMPWISANWGSLFRWKGEGAMPETEQRKLRDFVGKAHKHGRMVRFWATPEKPEIWQELLAAKVDLLGTDRLIELRQFLRDHSEVGEQ